jgi:hypothetical protein
MKGEKAIIKELNKIMLEYGYEDAIKPVSDFLLSIVREARAEVIKNHIKCGCKHVQPDYWCVCWFEGFETGEAEKLLKKV